MQFHREYYSRNYHNTEDNESIEERVKIFRGDLVTIDLADNTWEIIGYRGQGGKGVIHMLKHALSGDKPGLLVDDYEWFQMEFTANGKKWTMDPKCSRGW